MRISDWSSDVCSSDLGHQLKQWLFGGASIKVDHALFDVEASGLAIIAYLFGEDRYFADADAFWKVQDDRVAERRDAYTDEGWSDVVIVPRGQYFSTWEHCQAPKRHGGRIYIEVRAHGAIALHPTNVPAKDSKLVTRG